MTTSLIALQGARDRLCSEPLGKQYNPQDFRDAIRAYLQALCESPRGESLLTKYGEYIRKNTALVTQYALARQQGLASVSEILPVLKSVDKQTGAGDFSPVAILHWEALQDTRTLRAKRALQNKRTLVSYLPELKDEFNNVENVRSLLRDRRGDVVDALAGGPKVDGGDSNEKAQQKEPEQNVARERETEQKEAEKNIDRIQNAIDAWWSEANYLICAAENCHADGCRIMLQMYRRKLDAGETVMVKDKEVGAAMAATIQAAARFLAAEVGENASPELLPEVTPKQAAEKENTLQSQERWSKARFAKDWAKLLGISMRTFHRRRNDGTFRSKKQGQRIMICCDDLPDGID